MEISELAKQPESILSGVDLGFVEIASGWGSGTEEANTIEFCLNGVVYQAIENPDDGYRSMLGKLMTSTKRKCKNSFEPIMVYAEYVDERKTSWGAEKCDLLNLYDAVTGRLVLSVGTDNIDDYYPGFINFFDPKAMATNTGK